MELQTRRMESRPASIDDTTMSYPMPVLWHIASFCNRAAITPLVQGIILYACTYEVNTATCLHTIFIIRG